MVSVADAVEKKECVWTLKRCLKECTYMYTVSYNCIAVRLVWSILLEDSILCAPVFCRLSHSSGTPECPHISDNHLMMRFLC